MSYNPDSENRLEAEVMTTFEALGYETADVYHETFGADGLLGRDNRQDFVLVRYLKQALERLNPGLPRAAYADAIDQLTANRSIKGSLELANQEIYDLLKDGVNVSYHDPDEGGDVDNTLRVIDWNLGQVDNNHFLAVQQLWGETGLHTRRPDVVLFVNGLPLVLIELKAVHKQLRHAYNANLRDYKDTMPELMWYNAFILLSNGTEAKVGSISSQWEHFKDWKRINSEGEQGRADIESAVVGTCEKSRLLDLIENFTVFSTLKGSISKIVARNHQFLGVNNAIEAVEDRNARDGRLGVFWHTQGSGKSYSMVFLAQKVFRKLHGNWTFLIITDRRELDDQIYKTFSSSGAIGKKEEQEVRASSGDDLKKLLRDNDNRYVFTLIHKFHSRDGEIYPVLSERDDIVVITDEAHRTQYGTLASNMRRALPNASFIAFTGTPLISGEEEQTRDIFGEYVSVYDFKQSIEDEATVPLYYENRIPEVEVVNQGLDDDIYDRLDAAQLDDKLERELERQFSREYQVITRDDRLERVAEDIVEHYKQRGFSQEGNNSKAMVVCIDRFTAVRMYDKVRRLWEEATRELRREQGRHHSQQKRDELKAQMEFMRETDMAVVVSSSQNEVVDFQQKHLDILTHRQRLKDDDLDTDFKNPGHRLRMVFVCAMWMTGFDVPSCATIYLDKPMRNHTLMQTIARANRVFREKKNGLIVDYIGIFRDLEKALSIYGSATGGQAEDGEKPVQPRIEQIQDLQALVNEAIEFCLSIDIDVEGILDAGSYYDRIKYLEGVGEKVWQSEEVYNRYMSYTNDITVSVDAILPHAAAAEFIPVRQVLVTIAKRVNDANHVFQEDIEDVAREIGDVLDDSVLTVNWAIRDKPLERLHDLSQIDFDALKQRFEQGQRRTSVERLRGAMNRQLQQMVQHNQTRMSYLETFNQLIERYNAGAVGVDEIFSQLLSLVDTIKFEEQRHVKEGLSEEELAVFDLLMRPKKTLSDRERAAIKDTVKSLLHTLKTEKLKLDWRKNDVSRAAVRESISIILDEEWDEMGFPDDAYAQKVDDVYNHVVLAYVDGQNSIYGGGAAS